jgi:hypothetical protein
LHKLKLHNEIRVERRDAPREERQMAGFARVPGGDAELAVSRT